MAGAIVDFQKLTTLSVSIRQYRNWRLLPTQPSIRRARPILGQLSQQRCHIESISSNDYPASVVYRINDSRPSLLTSWVRMMSKFSVGFGWDECCLLSIP